ncbi:hypothetical protein ARALYDRAFT_339541 [Arabidopsis lyrata subsp. lyrata]|uniref:protein-tyrosine-phosphatase n=1 Tax=Arabidopsis lyrata subsp. lyrata TaxID=81972 RepID=D7KRA1_ARALL|nr:hypothetical protein ARALYDRAFT_339541 [Arabidopsis lyrata subsp. lyrata]
MGPRLQTESLVYVFAADQNSFVCVEQLIPISYYEHLPRRLPKTAILMGTGGKIWKVAMKSKHEKVYFERGWANFVADNALKDAEFLSFVFDGYRRYAVSIYGYGEKEINDDETKSDTDYSPDSLDTTTILVESVQVFNKSATSRKRANTIENPEAYLDDPNSISFETALKDRPYELPQTQIVQEREEDGVVPKKLYVRGIPYQSTEDEIRSYFRSCGVITKFDCKMRPEDGAFSAFITFETLELVWCLCFSFIDQAIQSGGGVLVHCFMGMSRSLLILVSLGTVVRVVAYLMKKHGMGFSKAVELIRSRRHQAYPNSGFICSSNNLKNPSKTNLFQDH